MQLTNEHTQKANTQMISFATPLSLKGKKHIYWNKDYLQWDKSRYTLILHGHVLVCSMKIYPKWRKYMWQWFKMWSRNMSDGKLKLKNLLNEWKEWKQKLEQSSHHLPSPSFHRFPGYEQWNQPRWCFAASPWICQTWSSGPRRSSPHLSPQPGWF